MVALPFFWLDKWMGNFRLCDRFSRLFHLESQKRALISEKGEWRDGVWSWVWNWGSVVRGRSINEFEEMLGLISVCHPKQQENDRLWWFLGEEGEFSVKKLKELVDENVLLGHSNGLDTKWNKSVPRKVNIFVWLLRQGRLPVRVVLDRIGMDLDSILCPCCQDMVESVDHCIIRCKWVEVGWVRIFKWWNMGTFNGGSIEELITHEGRHGFYKRQKDRWQAVVWTTAYVIWRIRNSVIFNNKKTNHIDLCAEV